MYTHERREKIMDLLQSKDPISVNELSNELEVSKATIRSDLTYLSNNNLIIRTHGGATKTKENEIIKKDINYEARKQINIEQKQEIAKKAMNFIKQGECIILDASSTCYELARLISQSDKKITVLTNGLRTATILKENFNLTVIVIGGVVKGKSNAIEGTLGIEILKKVNIDTLFTSAYAISDTEGLSDFNLYEVELKKKMIEVSTKTIGLVDSSKFGKKSIATFASLEQLDTIITDNQISTETKNNYINLVNIE
ncbi:DeoR/GlpR family DNA-binding transcription regulator [Vagococcus xieshaowenii]|uniref:DeoR/GlpR transcriptional regulator n=1 Tax=Vagococcus xieshaowenii TaxID=2562451 RepID=A0AAJ5EED1_9ENTE|nr:DeoR/GlpR family DNA-binding transcription regulator [Vagococcus xieshaowenii]QCA29426.1 DeoR/GlpR transcriptional regulator [Vagococcus xieshaowenii]TFZ41546.1 DeoR/GlpR transcriptional regulator [Vagococcus xieshaowenii]